MHVIRVSAQAISVERLHYNGAFFHFFQYLFIGKDHISVIKMLCFLGKKLVMQMQKPAKISWLAG
jgi:hypothetical protein